MTEVTFESSDMVMSTGSNQLQVQHKPHRWASRLNASLGLMVPVGIGHNRLRS